MKRQALTLCTAIAICCAVMALTDSLWQPSYWVKSAVKILLFLFVPLVVGRRSGMRPVSCLRGDKKAILSGLGLGTVTALLILVSYRLLAPWLDLSAIPAALEAGGGVTKENFLYVSLYIALCNSLLEEFFFRGFAFLSLKKLTSTSFAFCFSAAAFAVYHAAIIKGWFSPALFLLTLSALFVCGLFFNMLNFRRERIWASWLMHMGANLAINSIGMKLLSVH